MAYTTIDKPDEYFNTVLYTGNGSTKLITGVGFQPDWVWAKQRNDNRQHNVYDSVRGATKVIFTNSTNAESTFSTGLTSFDSDGFSLSSENETNVSSGSYVAWNWLAGGTASSNTDGSITSNVSANTTSGFSIVSYTGNGTAGATVGHGLGATPSMIIIKNRTDSASSFWGVYHKGSFVSQSDPGLIYINSTAARTADTNVFGNTTVTINSDVFSLGDYNGSNGSGDAQIAYCFAEKKGFSKFGSYVGNGNADGTFIYTGFKPAFVIQKKSSASGDNWHTYDNKRNTFNVTNKILLPNSSSAELTGNAIDFLSNGFKLRVSNSGTNQSGATYIYMAFAENPFVTSTGVPATAR